MGKVILCDRCGNNCGEHYTKIDRITGMVQLETLYLCEHCHDVFVDDFMMEDKENGRQDS